MQAVHDDGWSPGHVYMPAPGFLARPELSLIERGGSVVFMNGYQPVAVLRPVTDEERVYYATLAQRSQRMIAIVRDLPRRFADRLPADELEAYRTSIGAGEWHIPAGLIVASLVNRRIPVSPEEFDLMAELLELFRPSWERHPWLRTDHLVALNVIADEGDAAGATGP